MMAIYRRGSCACTRMQPGIGVEVEALTLLQLRMMSLHSWSVTVCQSFTLTIWRTINYLQTLPLCSWVVYTLWYQILWSEMLIILCCSLKLREQLNSLYWKSWTSVHEYHQSSDIWSLSNCGAEINGSLAREAQFIQTETVLKIEKGLQAALFAVNTREFQMDHGMEGGHGWILRNIWQRSLLITECTIFLFIIMKLDNVISMASQIRAEQFPYQQEPTPLRHHQRC